MSIRPCSGAQDIWGYGPVAMHRYVQFMAWTQGADPDKTTTYLKIKQYHPLFNMLRLRYVFTPDDKGVTFHEYKDWLPRALLINDWKFAQSREEIFQELSKPNFNPRHIVILEKASPSAQKFDYMPSSFPGPAKSNLENTCNILERGGDYVTVEANLASPAVLLITDNFSQGWRIKPLSPGMQKEYGILPANYTLMGIPLMTGKHLLRIEYRPLPFIVGAWISIISLIIYIGCLLICLIKKKSNKMHN